MSRLDRIYVHSLPSFLLHRRLHFRGWDIYDGHRLTCPSNLGIVDLRFVSSLPFPNLLALQLVADPRYLCATACAMSGRSLHGSTIWNHGIPIRQAIHFHYISTHYSPFIVANFQAAWIAGLVNRVISPLSYLARHN
jgi:hypothetical protein